MNRLIASTFASLVSVFHVIALIVILIAPVETPWKIVAIICYVLFAGILATLIAMNENLGAIRASLAPARSKEAAATKKATSGSSEERRAAAVEDIPAQFRD